MSWESIRHSLSGALRRGQHVVGQVSQEVAQTGAKAVSDAVDFSAGVVDGLRGRAEGPLEFPRTITVPTPVSHMRLVPGQAQDVVSLGGAHLNTQHPFSTFGLHMAAAGEARLDLEASGPGTDWGQKGRESAVLSVYIDGQYQQDVVLWGGQEPTPYALGLGNLEAGDHSVTLRWAKEKSTEGAKGVLVAAATVARPEYQDQVQRWAVEHAPILYGRSGLDNNHTDTPLGQYYSATPNSDGTTTLSYGFAYSNEDQGTAANPALEAARWGRLTDLQHVLDVTVDARGQVIDETFEGAGHHPHAFDGEHDGKHPILRTATGNNNVTDQGTGPLRFFQPPDQLVDDRAPTEDLMRRNPRWFEAMGKEVLREGKVDPTGVGDRPTAGTSDKVAIWLAQHGLGRLPRMADPRQYLYVQLKVKDGEAQPVTARVQLKDGRFFTSDLGARDAAIARDGWAQTTVRLPKGTRPEEVARLAFVSGDGRSRTIDQLGHVFMLDRDFDPFEVHPKSGP